MRAPVIFNCNTVFGSQRIPFDTIQYFFSRQHKVYIVTTEGTQSFYGKLGDLEGSLPSCFVRIHNRYFINLKYLDSLEKNCAIVGNTALPVSRSYKQSLSITYARYMLE
nr:LytTR family DNA-binding domain-containing protein [Zhenpiania hominis]